MSATRQLIRDTIRTVPDWPSPGIRFRDITPVLQQPQVFRQVIDVLEERYRDAGLAVIAAVDARGFLFAAPLADRLGIALVPVRKKGKLPFHTISQDYDLEYGSASVELHLDAVKPGEKVLVIDDLIATGGTMMAVCQLIRKLGGEVCEVAALVNLPDLKGAERLQAAGFAVFGICEFEGE